MAEVRLPDISGLYLQQHLARDSVGLPVILMTAFGDIPMSVKAKSLHFLACARYGKATADKRFRAIGCGYRAFRVISQALLELRSRLGDDLSLRRREELDGMINLNGTLVMQRSAALKHGIMPADKR